ncbi:MAG: sortase [Candidatus Scatovivens sp.]
MQLIISIIVIFILSIYFIINKKNIKTETSSDIKMNLKLNNIYNSSQTSKYLGDLIIEKIDLECPIFSEYSEENLKISVCKFSGNSLNENGNVAIVGHNYNNKKFFGELYRLEINDKILIESNR